MNKVYFFGLIFFVIYSILNLTHNYEITSLKNNLELKNKIIPQNSIFTLFLIKYTIVAGSIAFLVGMQLRELTNSIVDTIVSPILNIDLDKNGIPDLTELSKSTTITFGSLKFQFGPLILNIIKFSLCMSFTYIIVILLTTKTNLIDIDSK